MANRMKYQVELSSEQRQDLKEIVRRGRHSAREIRRARTLLLLDRDFERGDVADILEISASTVTNTARRYGQGGLERALFDEHRSGAPPKLTPRDEARIAAIACTQPPKGHSCWTLAMIRDRFLVWSDELDELSRQSIHRVLKKTT